MDKESYDIGFAEGKASVELDNEVKAEAKYEEGYEDGRANENARIINELQQLIRRGL